MIDSDRQAFRDLMEMAAAVYCEDVSSRFKPYWDVLRSRISIEDFAAALDRHMADPARGRFFPRPAELLPPDRDGGRPSGDEAWATVLEARDEYATVCWSAETAEAAGVARPILEAGDKVGARMAFLAAYARLVAQSVARGAPVAWSLSMGQDAARRADAVQRAVEQGRIGADKVRHLLPQPEAQGPAADMARLLTGKVVAHPAKMDGEYRQRMAELRAAIVGAEVAMAPNDAARTGLTDADERVLEALRRGVAA